MLLTSIILQSHSPLHAQQRKESDLQQTYIALLEEAGMKDPYVDSDGDVQFEYKEEKYFVEFYVSDLHYFRICCFSHATANSTYAKDDVYRVAAKVSAESKLVKSYLLDDKVWFSCELMFSDPEELFVNFSNYLDELEAAMALFDSEYTTN